MDDKVNLESLDIKKNKIRQLKEVFPEVVSEDKVDFEKLRLTLGDEVETGKERYGMNWPGKANCFKIIQTPSKATLKPAKEESVDFDNTENLFIEGDSLEVLKLLQSSYYGKVKMIYIDPPYNTGNDFVYPDNYTESLETYLRYTGQKGKEGLKLTTNTETEGRYHSKWMNMMYVRLFLVKNLLKESGIIFISIDEHEQDNLKKICNEIFGEENFAGEIVWKNSSKNDQNYISIQHEYLICYVKNKDANSGNWIEKKEGLDEIYRAFDGFRKKHGNDWLKIHEEAIKWFSQFSESNPIYSSKHYSWMDGKGVYFPADISGPNYGQYRYDVIHPITGKVCKEPASGWRYPEETMKQRVKDGLVHFGIDEKTIPNNKTYLKDTEFQSLTSVKYKDGRVASNLLIQIMGGNYFTNPKDVGLLKIIIKGVKVDENDIVLDFFAGSATTAHAVVDLNKEDGGNRKFIMVQIPEPTDENSEAYKAGYKNIAEIGKERIRRVIKKIKAEKEGKLDLDDEKQDLGFRVFKLDESNFKVWEGEKPEDLAKQLELYKNNVKDDSKPEDILYELILKSGFEISCKVEGLDIHGRKVYSVEDGQLMMCLEMGLTKELMKALAEKEPARVVCLDEGFEGNDQLLTNSVEIMKSKGIEFRTV